MSYDKSLAIKEESNYYPFGLKYNGYNPVKVGVENKCKFLGQVRQDELGLNWDAFRHRNYDYSIGSFLELPLFRKNICRFLLILMRGLGTIFAVLTDYMSPNFERTNERPLKDFAIDEKNRIKDDKVEEKTIEETGIKRYEGNPKHGKEKKGNAYAEPKTSQEALDNSLELPGNTTRRIGVDKQNNEFNVFDEHTEGKIYGHVREWGELSQHMKNLLIKAGLVNKKGKILKK